MSRFGLILAVLLSGLCCSPSFAQQAGDSAIVLQSTPVMSGHKSLQTAEPGRFFQVYDVRGDWLLVSAESTGWINKRNVATPKRAIEFFSERIRNNPKESNAYRARGNARLDLEQLDAAIEDFNKALELNPKDVLALIGRARARFEQEHDDAALDDFNTALAIAPRSANAWFHGGTFRALNRDDDNAIRDLNECLRLNPTYASAYTIRGLDVDCTS